GGCLPVAADAEARSAGRLPAPMAVRSDPLLQHYPYSRIWLGLALPLMLLANGRWVVPAAAWWAPGFLLRFVRPRPPLVGIGAGLIASIIVAWVAWTGMIPVPRPFYFLIAAIIGLTLYLPYAIDRLIAPRIGGFASSLVLPLAWTSIEWLNSVLSPYAS